MRNAAAQKFQSIRICFASAALALTHFAAYADSDLLGLIEFPNSGAKEAQADFIEGVLYLHNFEYEDAADAFKRAQEIDADFALAYWGEAMTYNHPLWHQQARESAEDALRRLARTAEERSKKAPTQREKDFLHAVEVLYGTTAESERLPKEERDDLYCDLMRRMHEQYPNDHEAATFYALSILGTASEGRDVATYMKSAAVSTTVWDANRNHPGAAHYLIHAYDDPDHAPLGLPMARAYSKIAPAAAHAQHMTSHIFVALGMWGDVVAANEIAIATENESGTVSPMWSPSASHYPYWLLYGYLQQGRYAKARELMETATERMQQTPNALEKRYFIAMRARYILDTQDWDAATRYTLPADESEPVYRFASAFSAIQLGKLEDARAHMNAMAPKTEGYETASTEAAVDVMKHQINGLIAIDEGDAAAGIALLEQAAALEAAMPFVFGPPSIVQPSTELLASALLDEKRFDEAIGTYERQLALTPLRAQSLIGLGRAQQGAGLIEAAAHTDEQLAKIWHDADANIGGYGDAAQTLSDTLD